MKNQTLLTALLVVVSLGVGFMIGYYTAENGEVVKEVVTENGGQENNTSNTTAESQDVNQNNEGTTISASALTPEQQQLLASLGIDANEINVTPEMIACAEAKLGVARIEEIKNGATPSFSEGFSLVACYN